MIKTQYIQAVNTSVRRLPTERVRIKKKYKERFYTVLNSEYLKIFIDFTHTHMTQT